MKTWTHTITLAIFLMIVSGCKSDEVTRYTIPKEPKTIVDVNTLFTTEETTGFTWTAPKTWTQNPASGFRIASYTTPEGNDVSVVKFPGDAGGNLSNLNRWRDQLFLEPITTLSNVNLNHIHLKNSTNFIDGAFKSTATETWFFKVTGTLDNYNKTDIQSWLKSIQKTP